MSVAFMLDFAESDPALYDEVLERMQLGGRLTPDGALFHVAGPGPSGGWRVLDVWESDEKFQAFAESSIMPITSDVGMSPPSITRFEVHNTRDTGAARGTIRFFQIVRFPGMDEAQFDAMDAEVLAPGIPEAMPFHVNGGAEGDWIVADGWTSKEERDRFMESQVFPTAAKHPEVSRPSIDDMAVHNTLEPVG